MACFAKPLSLFFLLVLSSSMQIEARESVFFSKFTTQSHYNKNGKEPKISITEVPTPAPSPALVPAEAPEVALVPAPAPSYTETEHGYGLYSLGSTKKKPTTIEVEDEEIVTEEQPNGGESFETAGYQNTNLYTNKNGYVNNYNANGYTNNYNPNGSGNSHEMEQQGMSDTRFLENGSYYHDVKNEKNNYDNFNYGYESAGRGSTRNEGYNGNYGEHSNEFNTMEEYEKYQESQGYVP